MNNLKATNLFIVNRLVAVVISLLLVSVLGYAGVCLYNNVNVLTLVFFLVGNFFLTTGIILLIWFSINRTALSAKTLVVTILILVIGLGAIMVPIIANANNNSYGPALWAVVDAEEKKETPKEEPKPETPKQEVAEETVRYEASSTDYNDYNEYVEETEYVGNVAKGGGNATPVTTTPEVIEVVSPPIELVPDETIPTVPETDEPIVPNEKPVVKIDSQLLILYIGETLKIMANVTDSDSDSYDYIQKDVVVEDENILSATSEETEDGVSIEVTGNSPGTTTIQLDEGVVVDSNGEVSDASNIVTIKVMEEVVEESPEVPLEPETPSVDEPTTPDGPSVDEPTTPDGPSVDEPVQQPSEVPSGVQSPDTPVFE